MSSRDIQLVIRARDEASRALQSVAAELDALLAKQQGLTRSGPGASASIAGMVAELAKFEKVSGLVAAAADRSEAAITKQRTSLQQNAAALAAVNAQMAAAQQSIGRQQAAIVDTRLNGGDTAAQIARLKATQAEIANLEAQQRRLSNTVAAQRATLGEQERAFREVASMANAAEAAVRSLGTAEERAALQSAAAAEAAGRAAVARRMSAARASFNGPQDNGNAAPRAADTALAQMLRDEDAHARSLQALLDKANPVAVIHRKLAGEIEILRGALKRGSIDAEGFAKAEAELTRQAKTAEEALDRVGKGASGKPTLFGLKPYELTNLGYQANDVLTGLASGQRPMQIIAQQGGQILQLMPQIGDKITAAFKNPYLLAAAAVFALMAAGIKNAADEAARLREINGILDSTANGLTTTAEAWSTQIRLLREYGLSAREAMDITKTFYSEGLNPKRFDEFGKTARDMADVLGIDVTEAAKMFAEAFKGGYDSVAALDDKLNFLTASEREHIRTLFESGQAEKARIQVQDILARKFGDGADKMRGPWTEAIRRMGNAWDDLTAQMGNTWWAQDALGALNGLASALDWLTGSSDKARDSVAARMSDQNMSRRAFKDDPFGAGSGVSEAEWRKSNGLPALPGDPKAEDANSTETKRSNDILHSMGLERELEKLRQDGARATENLRYRNESFLTAAEQRRRMALAGELAATRAIGDQRVKDAARAEAVDREKQAIQRERDQYESASSTALMQTRRFIMARESFQPTAKWDVNHYRLGYGSDTITSPGGAPSTVTAGMSTTKEAALRDLDRRIVEFQNGIKTLIGANRFNAFSSEQQAALTSIAYNYGTIGRTKDGHGAGIADVVRSGTIKEIADAIRSLAGHNGGVNRKRRNIEADLFLTPNSAIEADNEHQAEDAAQRQNEFNAAVERSVAEQKRHTAELESQAKLRGEALVQEQIRAAGDKAVADLERQIAEKNANLKPYERKLELTQAQRDAARQAAEAEARAANLTNLANARTDDAMRRKNDLQGERDAIAQQIAALRALGQDRAADALLPRLKAVNAELLDAIDSALRFYESLDPETDPLHRTREQIEAVKAGLREARAETANWHDQLEITPKMMQDAFAGSFKDSIKGFAKDIAEGKNVFESFGRAALSFVQSFTQRIADIGLDALAQKAAGALGFGKMAGGMNSMLGLGGGPAPALNSAGMTLSTAGTQLIAAASALQASAASGGLGDLGNGGDVGDVGGAISGSTGPMGLMPGESGGMPSWIWDKLLRGGGGAMAGGGGLFGGLFSIIGSIFHTGGIAGMSAPTRSVNPAWFAGAFRYHGGGIAGLRPDEVPAILQKGEEILTRANPRHSANGGGSGDANIKIVNAFDAGQVMSEAMGTEAGQRAFVNFVRQNRRAVNSVLKG